MKITTIASHQLKPLVTAQIAILIAFFCVTGTAFATSYRIDFSGTVLATNDAYSGYAIVDYSVPNTNGASSQGLYENAVTQFELQFGGSTYTLDQTTSNTVTTINDDVFYGADIFAFAVNMSDTSDDSDGGQFLFQLADSSMTVFNSIDLPTSLSIADFDPTTGNFFGTGAFLLNVGSSPNPIDFVQIAPVPLPAGLLLLLSGLGTVLGISIRDRV